MSLIGNNHSSLAFRSHPFLNQSCLYAVFEGKRGQRKKKKLKLRFLDSAPTVLSDESNCMFQTNDSLSFISPPDLICIFLSCFQL